MKKTWIWIGLCLAAGVVSGNADEDPRIARVLAGELHEAKASWWGYAADDNTANLQAAINSRVATLIVDRQSGPWITRGLTLVSNQHIVFEKGVELLAKKDEFRGKADALMTLHGVTNVTLTGYGATLRMRRMDYHSEPYVHAEWRHVLSIKSAAQVRILGLTLAESGGDGIYLGSLNPQRPNVDILIRDVCCEKNYRQGISVISAQNLRIENTVLRDTWGTAPAAGIDFEPNHAGEQLSSITMVNCVTENNYGDGYAFYLPNLTATSQPVSIVLENCRSVRDRQRAVMIAAGNGAATAVKGSIRFEDCQFERSGKEGLLLRGNSVEGLSILFNAGGFALCGATNSVAADIVLSQVNDDRLPVGNMRFDNATIVQPRERPWLAWQPMQDIIESPRLSGTLRVNSNVVALTSEWLTQHYPPLFSVRIPRVPCAWETVTVTDPHAQQTTPYSPIRIRARATYLFYAQAGQTVAFTAVQTRVGRSARGDQPVAIASVNQPDRVLHTAGLSDFNTPTQIRMVAPTAGFYRMNVMVGAHACCITEGNVPLALSAEEASVGCMASTGSLYVPMRTGTECAAIGVSASPAERVAAQLLTPRGHPVWSQASIQGPVRYVFTAADRLEAGLWQLRIAKPEQGCFEDFSVDVRGVPACLFVSPDRYWF